VAADHSAAAVGDGDVQVDAIGRQGAGEAKDLQIAVDCPASTPLADWRQSSWPVRAADRPQVVADDNLPATVA
jgi:hypothetical protein